ncbi:MAG: DNA cytosine methyltransferase [Solibacillus sp.]
MNVLSQQAYEKWSEKGVVKILELFGGIGASTKAMKNLLAAVLDQTSLDLKLKVIDYVEWKQDRVQAYNAMNPQRYEQQDITTWNLCPDICVHGSPCQDNSAANLNADEELGRSLLMLRTIDILKEMGDWKPRVVIWENVKGALYKKTMPIFNQYLNDMQKLGYTNSFDVVSAYDHSLPQKRERVFCVSILGEQVFDFSRLKQRLLQPMNEFIDFDLIDERYVVNAPSMLNRIEDLASVEDKAAAKGRYRFLHTIKDFCYTITERPDRAPSMGVIQMPDGRYRYATERECWRLMGFDDADFDLMLQQFPMNESGLNRTLYRLAGNSIAVPVLESIFEVILNEDYATELVTNVDGQLELIC